MENIFGVLQRESVVKVERYEIIISGWEYIINYLPQNVGGGVRIHKTAENHIVHAFFDVLGGNAF